MPEGWTWSTIHSIAETIFGQSPPSSSYNKDGNGLPFFQGKAEFGDKYPVTEKWSHTFTREAKSGDILISIRAPVGPINVADRRCAIGRGLAAIRPIIEADYVRFWLKRSEGTLVEKATGTTFCAISKNTLNTHPIPVAPLKEQHRIAEKIERLFARLDKGEEGLCKARRLLSLYRQSILKDTFAGHLVPQDPNDEPVSELLKRIANEKVRLIKKKKIKNSRYRLEDKTIDPPFKIPKSWQWCRLGSIGAIIGGGTPSTANLANFAKQGEGIPWLTPADLSNYSSLYIERGSRDLSKIGLQSSGATVMPAGTVLFTSRAPIGYTAIASNPISTNQGFKSIVPYITECSRFIALAMQAFASDIEAVSSGTTFKEATGRVVSAFPIPLPPLAEQRRIIEKIDTLFDQMNKLEKEIENTRRLVARCRQSILKNAFTGRLVLQDPNDEPSIELLARIQKTRSVTAKKRNQKLKNKQFIGGN